MATISGALPFEVSPEPGESTFTAIVESPSDIWDAWLGAANGTGATPRLELATSPTFHYQHVTVSNEANKSCLVDVALTQLNLTFEEHLRFAFVRMYQSWTSSHNRVLSFDPASGTLCLEGVYHGAFPTASYNRYNLQNVRYDAWLTPNTFRFEPTNDSSAGTARVRLRAPQCAQDGCVLLIPQLQTIVTVASSQNVIVGPGVRIAHSASGLSNDCLGGCGQSASSLSSAAFEVWNSEVVTLESSTISGTGAYAAWVHEGCHNITVSNCTITDLGAGGVRIGEPRSGVAPNPASVASHVTVVDSLISDAGHTVEAGCGILLQQARDSALIHNTIENLFYTGISLGWDWEYGPTSNANLNVSFNIIRNIMRDRLSDGGCVYNLGDSPGTVIANNLCSDVLSRGYGGWGYYCDQASRGLLITNNIAQRTRGAGLHQHFGLDNVVVNNVFAHPLPVMPGLNADSSGIRSSQDSPTQPSSFAATRTIVLLDHASSIPLFNTQVNSFNNITLGNNIYWSTAVADPAQQLVFPPRQKPVNFTTWTIAEAHDKGSIIADPQFCTDPATGHPLRTIDAVLKAHNYTCFAPSSPAWKLGIKPIDMSSVGRRT